MAAKRKITILGGGIGGLAAAWELTRTAELRSQYEVTVYQMGWRLGGKGASGRNQASDKCNRIEEHGLHIWLGNYENAFRLMRECYQELSANGLAPGSPFQSWDDAFKKQNRITMMEMVDGQWQPWSVTIPPNDREPGTDRQCISLVGIIKRIFELLNGVKQSMPRYVGPRKMGGERGGPSNESPQRLFLSAFSLAQELSDIDEENTPSQYEALHSRLESFTNKFLYIDPQAAAPATSSRHRRILIELALTLAKAILKDLLLKGERSFDVVDHYDFREWLTKHGASQEAIDSAPVRCCYEIVFGYKNGDGDPDFAAGVAARFVLRWVLTYQGALIYKMQAGMGDIVFAPLYRVLDHRGVKFKFFHRLERLELSADKSKVAKIVMDRQVDLTVAKYDPIEVIEDVPCWPSQPRFAGQIDPTQSAALEQMHADNPGMEPLESAYSPWNERPGKTTVTLNVDHDFQDIVLAVPVGALPIHAQELIDANTKFAQMVTAVKTVATQSFQLWLNRDLSDLQWFDEPTILDSYTNSWADFTHLEAVESFPSDSVHGIAYFCKALGDRASIPDPGPDPTYPVEETERVKTWSRDDFLNGVPGMRPIWPGAYDQSGFRWDWLTDLGDSPGAGPVRFESQFWCANVNPSDRYVQALTDTTKHRLRADESGFSNVALAGDWTRTGINAGCIEGATIGGMQAARAISGVPEEISGEFDFCPLFSRVGAPTGCVGLVLAPLRAFLNLFPGIKKLLCDYVCEQSMPVPPPHTTPVKPAFVERGGVQTFPHPFQFIDVNVDAFLVQVAPDNLRGLCDKYLNQPTGGQVNYRPIPLFDRAMLVKASIHKCIPEVPEYEYGWIPEVDVALWVPLLSLSAASPPRIVWFQPYVFVDHPWAVTCGREVFGFPKAMSRFEFSTDANPTSLLKVIAPAADTLDATLEVTERTILEVTGDPLSVPTQAWSASEQVECFNLLTANLVTTEAVPLLEGAAPMKLAPLFDFANPTFVFLKQFRDVSDGRNACYQAITEATADVFDFSGGSQYEGSRELQVPTLVSHPIGKEFGWAATAQPILSAWNFRFSFRMTGGREVWRA